MVGQSLESILALFTAVVFVDAEENILLAEKIDQLEKGMSPAPVGNSSLGVIEDRGDLDLLIVDVPASLQPASLHLISESCVMCWQMGI